MQKAFLTLLHDGCLFQDLVQLKGKDLLTPVSRILIGQPGCTYKYLNTRLFAVPWAADEHHIRYSTEDVSSACKAFHQLNTFLHRQTIRELNKLVTSEHQTEHSSHSHKPKSSQDAEEFCQEEVGCFNVTLINYMNPQTMLYLREEPYYGMGKMAVSWHHDENLVKGSTVAVYNYSYQGQKHFGCCIRGGWWRQCPSTQTILYCANTSKMSPANSPNLKSLICVYSSNIDLNVSMVQTANTHGYTLTKIISWCNWSRPDGNHLFNGNLTGTLGSP